MKIDRVDTIVIHLITACNQTKSSSLSKKEEKKTPNRKIREKRQMKTISTLFYDTVIDVAQIIMNAKSVKCATVFLPC